MKAITASLCAALLSGCSSMLTIPKEGMFEAKPKAGEMRITWVAVANSTAMCKKLFPESMHHYPIIPACAGWNELQCVIVTGITTNHQVLGHEVRHCFEGNFHD